MLAMAPSAPVMSLLAISSCSSVTAATMTSASSAGPKATRTRSRACRAPAARLSCTRVTPGAQVRPCARAHGYGAAGPVPDVPDEGDCCSWPAECSPEAGGGGLKLGNPVGGVEGPSSAAGWGPDCAAGWGPDWGPDWCDWEANPPVVGIADWVGIALWVGA
ncbi:Uncharacterised protein [Mycobacterium tuberculosis]|nr:Uncharacterised protein [Mycobacterium tuberculosis]